MDNLIQKSWIGHSSLETSKKAKVVNESNNNENADIYNAAKPNASTEADAITNR